MRDNYNNFTDAQLAALYNQQDRNAFEEIYVRYKDLLYIHAKKMLREKEQAQDVVQELFTTLLVKMGEVELKSTIKSYLYHLIQNKILDLFKHQKVRFNYVESIQNFQSKYVNNADHLALERELIKTIDEEIERLPPKMKAIFEMSRKAYLSNQEIALATNTSEENVRRQLRIALTRIRSKFTCFLCLQIMTAILWLNRNF